MSQAWFTIALDDGDGVRLVIAPGEQLGDAIDVAVRRSARGRGGQAPWPIAAEPAAASEVPLGESVGKGVVALRPVEGDLGVPSFRWPSGVLPTIEGARRLGRAEEGFARSSHGAVQAVEAVVSGERLVEVFMQVVERLPAADNVEVRVTGHYDDTGRSEVWLSPRGDVRRAIRFLDDHDVELLGNGHVELAVYLRATKGTLRLTEHKTIVWLGEGGALVEEIERWLAAATVPAATAPLALVSSVDHYHWRPSATRNRKKLLQHLERLRMRRVDAWDEPS